MNNIITLTQDVLEKELEFYQTHLDDIQDILQLDESDDVDELDIDTIQEYVKEVRPIGVTIHKLIKVPFAFPPYFKKGETVGLISTNVNNHKIMAVVPRKEFSSYHNNFGNHFERKRNVSLQGYVIDKKQINQRTVYIVSTRKAYRVQTKPDIIELMQHSHNGEGVLARILGFSEYGAILRWHNLDLTLTNSSFGRTQEKLTRHRICIQDIYNVDEDMLIKFDRLKKSKRVIQVKPFVEFPVLDFNSIYDRKHFIVNDCYWAKVISQDTKTIHLQLGFYKDEHSNRKLKVSPVKAIAHHPLSSSLDSLIDCDQVVYVKILSDNGRQFLTQIIDVEDDIRNRYRNTYIKMVVNKIDELKKQGKLHKDGE